MGLEVARSVQQTIYSASKMAAKKRILAETASVTQVFARSKLDAMVAVD